MVLVEGGTFKMGFTTGERYADKDEFSVHEIEINSYYIDRYEVTNAQYVTYLNEVKPKVFRVEVGNKDQTIYDVGYTVEDTKKGYHNFKNFNTFI